MDSSFKGVVLNYLDYVLYDMKRGNLRFTICKEAMYTNAFVFYFARNSYLIDKFNEVAENCKSAGILNFIHSKYINTNLMMKMSQRSPAQALNYDHIEGFFTIFCGGCVLAFISFVCEIKFPNVN